MSQNCPICNSQVSKVGETRILNEPFTKYSCPRCGNYMIESAVATEFAKELQGDINKSALLSHWVRTKFEADISQTNVAAYQIIVDKNLIENIIKQPLPKPAEQADKFVLWLGNSKNHPGEFVKVKADTHQSIMGAVTPRGFGLVLEHLVNEGFLNKDDPLPAQDMHLGANIYLSFKGWDRFHQLKRGSTDSRKAFMAMEYGYEQLEKIVEKVFKPAVRQTGFDLFKLVDRPKAGLIDDRLRVEIQTSRFLIADLTHENAGAYWEAGYAEGLGKPVIYTCEKKKFEEQKTHFDTNHHLTIPWDEKNPKEAAEELKATIRATLPGEAKLTDE